MTDIQRDIGLLDFLDRYPYVDGPLAPPVAAFLERLQAWPLDPPMITFSTMNTRPLRLPTEFLLLNHETGSLEKHVSEQSWLGASYAAGRTVLAQWRRDFGSSVSDDQHQRPRATIVDDIDAEFESR